MKKITIIHPSKGRPEMAMKTIANWMGKAKFPNDIQYILSIDTEDCALYWNALIKEKVDIDGLCKASDNKSAIEAINKVVHLAKSDLFIVVSDDFDCFQDWDEYLLTRLIDCNDFIVKTYDGEQDWLITLPIMDRTYYNRFGYIYHPDYKHMFSDTEMTTVAHYLNKVIDLQSNINVFTHNHYTTGAMEKDKINEKNDATWSQGEELFRERLSRDFDLPVGQINVRNRVLMREKLVAYIQ